MSDLLFVWALALCPREFRANYGQALKREFRAQGAGISAACDIAATGVAEHWDALGRNVRVAVRSLSKARLFSVVAIATLAVAISVNAAVFGAINAVLLQPLPFVDAQHLVLLCKMSGHDSACFSQLPNDVSARIESQSKTLESIAAYQYNSATLLGRGHAQAVALALTTTNYFSVVGIHPELGRFFQTGDDRRGKHVVVISHDLWQQIFSGAPDVIGKSVNLDGTLWTVIGVAPHFVMPQASSDLQSNYARLWEPGAGQPGYNNWAFARIKHDAPVAAVQADLKRIAHLVVASDPVQYKGLELGAVGLADWYLRLARPLLFIAFAAVLAVLVIACANVANLLLVRAVARRTELAMRNALGATRRHISLQLLTEITVLAVVAAVAGLGLGRAELRLLVTLAPDGLPRIGSATVDLHVAALTAVLVALATAGASLVTVIAGTPRNLSGGIKSGARSGEARRTSAVRTGLAIVEIALAFAVVVSAGLLVRSFAAQSAIPLGFEPHGIYRGSVGLGRRYESDADVARFARALILRLRSIPGVREAALARNGAFSENGFEINGGLRLAGRTYSAADVPPANIAQVSSGYFRALGIRVEHGRTFSESDTANTPLVAIVDADATRRYFTGGDPVGKRIVIGSNRIATIVGVVDAVAARDFQPTPPMIYLAFNQFPSGYPEAIVKTVADVPHLRDQVEAAIATVDPDVSLVSFRSLEQYVGRYAARTLANAELLGVLAIVALVLAVAGIYAVISYSVQLRTQEFGVRKAIGARAGAIAGGVLRGALWYAALGILLGIAVAGAFAHILDTLLFATSAVDLVTFAAVTALLVASTLVAALVPALRAMRLEPAIALRYE